MGQAGSKLCGKDGRSTQNDLIGKISRICGRSSPPPESLDLSGLSILSDGGNTTPGDTPTSADDGMSSASTNRRDEFIFSQEDILQDQHWEEGESF